MNTIQRLNWFVMWMCVKYAVGSELEVEEHVPHGEEKTLSASDREPRIFKYNQRRTPTLFTIFSSVEVRFETGISGRLKVVKGNSSLNRDEPLWKRAFKAAWEKSGYIFKEKISPFHEECFSVEYSGVLKYSYRFVGFDRKNFGWFVCGCIMFTLARKLSRSVVFHYTSGASLGILMSSAIILILLYKLLPYKRVILASVATGCSVGIYFVEDVLRKLWEIIVNHPYESFAFCAVTGIISMALMYYFGPPSNERSFNLIQWGLQAIAVYMIYQSTYWKAFAITVVVVLAIFQFISFTNMFKRVVCFLFPKRFYLFFNPPPKRKLLTQEEYEEQGRVETEKALKELSFYCSSPQCNSWKVVRNLGDPKRFANFLDDGKQFTPDEIESYESGDFSLGNSYIDRDEQPGLFSSSPRKTSGSLSSLSSGHSERGGVNRTPNGRVWISDDEDSLANLED